MIIQQNLEENIQKKDPVIDKNFLNKIEAKNKQENFDLGDLKNDYITEFADKYRKPKINLNDLAKQTVSTEELQESHYKFGNQKNNWETTFRVSYPKKKIELKPINKGNNTTEKSNFKLGEDGIGDYKSTNMVFYKKLPYVYTEPDKNLINELRNHHFKFGADNSPLLSTNRADFQYPKIINNSQYKIKKPELQKDNFDNKLIGEYNTTYDTYYTQKKIEKNEQKDNSLYESSFKIGSDNIDYKSDYKRNYIPRENNINLDEINKMRNLVNNIKSSHFDLGDLKNDYSTEMLDSYQYDPDKAKNAAGDLNQDMIN